MEIITNRRLMIALAAAVIAVPGVANRVLAQSTDTPMEEMIPVYDVDTNAAAEPEMHADTANPAVNLSDPQPTPTLIEPAGEEAPSRQMAPDQRALRAIGLPAVARPARPTGVDQTTQFNRLNQMYRKNQLRQLPQPNQALPNNWLNQDTATTSTMYPVYPTYHPIQNRADEMTTIPNYRPSRSAADDLFDTRRGDRYIGFTPSSPIRRPKYAHSRGPGRDFRNIRTNQDYFALPRHGGGQDLFDPHRGRVIHGIRRRDGSIDYYDPDTGRWMLTQNPRRR